MYDIKQFRPTLYLVLLMGLTGFAVATESPGLWVLGAAAMGVHAWLSARGWFRPLPRVVANVVTMVSLGYTFLVIRTMSYSVTPIVTIGQFLVLLHLVKLFELRANRDYAQLLVLSLLLMVAGAISTASLVFGLLFLAYLFVSLYCCLLFHLKVENDAAVAAQVLPPDKVNDATLRQDQRFLARSMKKLAVLVTTVAVIMAVLVFLFIPRNAGAGMFGQLQFRPGQTLTGFSDEPSFGELTRIQQNTEVVAQVQVFHNDRPVEGTVPLLLRGRTFDRYDRELHKWERTPMRHDPTAGDAVGAGATQVFREPWGGHEGGVWRQVVSLKPTGTKALFALPGVVSITPGRDLKVRYYLNDRTLALAGEPLTARLEYTVISQGVDRPQKDIRAFRAPRPDPDEPHAVSPMVIDYARRPDVCGTDDGGRPLATLRDPNADATDLDARIAENIAAHLRSKFAYTLDLKASANRDTARYPDHIEQFLYDWKRGHCEHFASAMTLMCQGLGIDARMVTGFKCDEFDAALGKYYLVRQSHAHAWVEVRTPRGWVAFDPTSGNQADPAARSAWATVKHFFAYIEFKWATAVIAYDSAKRDDLISSIDRQVVTSMVNSPASPHRLSGAAARWWRGSLESLENWRTGGGAANLITYLIALLVFAMVAAIAWFYAQRWRMRRRATAIGLDTLPTSERMRLARQLGFYARLTALLARHDVVRPAHQTPGEFAQALTFLPGRAYDVVRRATDAFYQVRFGGKALAPEERRELNREVENLTPLLAGGPAIR